MSASDEGFYLSNRVCKDIFKEYVKDTSFGTRNAYVYTYSLNLLLFIFFILSRVTIFKGTFY